MIDRTLAVIRQAAVANYQVGHIRKHIEKAGFKIIVQQKLKPQGDEAIAFVQSINAEGGSALVLEREYAAHIWLGLIPVIQRRDAEHLPADSLYGSSKETAAEEIGYLFPKYRPMPAVQTQDAEFANSPLVTFGEPDDRTLQQMRLSMSVGSVVRGVLCADAHVGFAVPVGGVLAYDNMLSSSAVGTDIGCGNMAAKTNLLFGDIKHQIPHIAKIVDREISFGLGRQNQTRVEHEVLDDADHWHHAGAERFRVKAQDQLGTVGGGNHYVDFFYEVPLDLTEPFDLDKQHVWIGVHFGSRGFGYGFSTMTEKLAGGKAGMFVTPTVLRADSELGQRYASGMELASRYANAGREWVVDTLCKRLGARKLDIISNHHNHAWLEEHFGRKLWVVRKGATPAFPGQRGFVGGSMGDDAVIIEGVDSEKSRAAMYSTIHGAGRVFSRTEAKKTFTRHQMEGWLRERNVILIGGGLDESPMAYRRLDDVLKFHEGTIKINHRLRPFLVAMAGDDVHDPFRD